jgi:hypothetical protein
MSFPCGAFHCVLKYPVWHHAFTEILPKDQQLISHDLITVDNYRLLVTASKNLASILL